jgi:hypothetical protein
MMRSARRSLLALGVTAVGVMSGTGSALAASPTDDLLGSVQQTVGSVTQTVTQATAPVTNAAQPATDAAKPVTDAVQQPTTQAPAQQPAAPAPAPNPVKTVTDAVAPVTNAVKPVTDAVKLPTGAQAPAADNAKPSADAPKAPTDVLKPVTNAVKPVQDAVSQVTNAVKPVADTAKGATGKVGAPSLPGEMTTQRTNALNGGDDGGDIASDNEVDVEVGDVLSDLVDVVVTCNSVAAILAKADNDANCGKGGRKGGKDDDHGKPAAYSASSLGGGGDIASDNDIDVEVGDIASDLIDVVVACNSVAAILAKADNDANCGKGGRKGGKDDDGKPVAYSASNVLGDGGGDILSDNDIDVEVGDVLSDLVDVVVSCNSVALILAKADNDANCGKGGRKEDALS